MSNIGDPYSSTIPVVGTFGTGYAQEINDFLQETQDRLESKVPLSSLQIGTLNMANNPIQNLEYASFQDGGFAPGSPINSLQSFGHNLYWVSNAGACQITNGASLNAGSIGGITGDYGGVNPAQFRFVDADKIYYAYDDFGGGAWAGVWAQNFFIAGGSTSAHRVKLAYGGTADFTLTVPATLPGATNALQLSSAGQISVISTNDSITLSGTGTYKHGTKSKVLPLGIRSHYTVAAGSVTEVAGTAGCGLANNSIVYFALPVMAQHERIVAVTVYFDSAADRNACTCVLYQTSNADPQTTAFSTTSISLTTAGTALLRASSIALSSTNAQSYYVQISNSVTTPKIQSIVVDYDVP